MNVPSVVLSLSPIHALSTPAAAMALTTAAFVVASAMYARRPPRERHTSRAASQSTFVVCT